MTPTHHHAETGLSKSALLFAVSLTGITLIAEVAGGFYSHSLALLSDAGHVFMDLTALLFALFALALAARPISDRRTYGLHRLEVLAALANGGLVVSLAFLILWESANRLSSTATPRLIPMAILGVLGLLVNVIVAWRLHDFARRDINLRAVFLHVASDALASLGVVLGAGVIALTGWTFVDPLVGIAIALVILVNALGLLRDALNLLLEGVPRHLQLSKIEATIRAVPGVLRVEDIHLWGLCSHLSSLSAHVKVHPDALADTSALLKAINTPLREQFQITHTTFQLEPH